MSASSTLFLLVAVVGAMTAAGYVHYKRTQTQMRDQVCGVAWCGVMCVLGWRSVFCCKESQTRSEDSKCGHHTPKLFEPL